MKSLLLLATAGLIASAAAQGFWQPQCNTPLPELPANLTEPTWDACRQVLAMLDFGNRTDNLCTDRSDTCTTYSIGRDGVILDCAISVCWLSGRGDHNWCVSQRQAYHGLTALFDACDSPDNEAGTGFVDAEDMVFAVFGQNQLSSRSAERVEKEIGHGDVIIVETIPIAELGRR